MIPIKQKTRDDCFRACVASLLELALDDIPDFTEEEKKGWYDEEGNMTHGEPQQFLDYVNRLNSDFLSMFNLNILPARFNTVYEFPRGYSIKSGTVTSEGPAKGFDHAMVAFNGDVIHDPSPTPNREYRYDNTYYVFIILDPCVIKEVENDES